MPTEPPSAATAEQVPAVQAARAKPLPRHLPLTSDPPELVPARMINEALYCERLMYLEWAQGEFANNFFTVGGRFAHRRADEPSGTLPRAEEQGGAPFEARSLWLSSEEARETALSDRRTVER